jgi:hypothetical protein
MNGKPILFSAPMIRAILREIAQPGTGKTQTRRVIEEQFVDPRPDDLIVARGSGMLTRRHRFRQPHPVGERLYVREAWRTEAAYDDLSPASMGGEEPIQYEAVHHQTWDYPPISRIGRLRQGIHMPRWASRFTLIVTDVRVQRLQEISEGDAIAEGPGFVGRITGEVCESVTVHRLGVGPRWRNARDWYADLWDSLNAARGHSWKANPWVVAYTFRALPMNIDEVHPCL